MKHIAIIFVTSLLASCNLFQRTQPAGESVVVEEAQKQQEEVFVPVEKELYVVIQHCDIQYQIFIVIPKRRSILLEIFLR